MLKQVIVIRDDLKLPKGKMAVQTAHASVDAILKSLKTKSGEEKVKEWRNSGMPKIAVKAKDEKELYKYLQIAKNSGLVTSLITDAGKTTVALGTVTCFGIGPDEEKKIDSVTGELGLI